MKENEGARNLLVYAAKELGFGASMHIINDAWKHSLVENGYPFGGAFSVGPCEAEMVDCDCDDPVSRDWCCGRKRVTKRVLDAKHQLG